MKSFFDEYLDEVLFQEFHKDFPHHQWTLGFAGRPGGPDFYINKIDNTENHGPGGQDHYDLYEEADPCFGRIVDGFDVLEKIFALPAGNYHILDVPVHIVRMRIQQTDRRILQEDAAKITAIQDERNEIQMNPPPMNLGGQVEQNEIQMNP